MNYRAIITIMATQLGTDVDTLLKTATHENPCFLCFGIGTRGQEQTECPHCSGKGFEDEEDAE